MLVFCVPVLPQQKLTTHNDSDDPCKRFKIRILVPAEVADHKLPFESPRTELDPKIIWNPCEAHERSTALLLSTPKSPLMDGIKPQPFLLSSRPAKTDKSLPFLFGSEQPAFNFFKRQR